MQTLGSLLDRNKGLGPGFDFLRIFLALAIVAWHSRNVVYWTSDTLTTETPFWFGEYCLVPIFFALSGFLVAGSGMRLTLANFLVNRGLRILPALALEILFSAFFSVRCSPSCRLRSTSARRCCTTISPTWSVG